MRITFVLPPVNLSGGIRVVGVYASQLERRGHQVKLISTTHARQSVLRKAISLMKGHVRKQVSTSHLDQMSLNHVVLDHSGPVTDNDVPDADVVVATWWETAPWVAALSPQKGAKVYFMQDYGAPGQEIERIAPTWRLPLHIVTISEWLRDLIYSHHPDADVTVVPNAVDFEMFDSPERGKKNRPTVGFAYRTLASKGMDTAISAIEKARRELPDLAIVAYGPPDIDNALLLPEGTLYHVEPDDSKLGEIYASCDAWIVPSRIEGFGLPILEAMACHTPVIATMAGAAPELVTPDRGILVPVGDSQAMADAIVRMAKIPEAEWRSMSKAGYTAARSYSWSDATTLFEAALCAVAGNRPGGARSDGTGAS